MIVRSQSPHRASVSGGSSCSPSPPAGAGSHRIHCVLRRRHYGSRIDLAHHRRVQTGRWRRQQRLQPRADRRRTPRDQLGRRRRRRPRPRPEISRPLRPPAAPRSRRRARDFCKPRSGVTEFTSLDASYATTFVVFTAERNLTPTGSNVTNITFSLPNVARHASHGFRVWRRVLGCGPSQYDKDRVFRPGQRLAVFVERLAGRFHRAERFTLFCQRVATAGEKIARIMITTGNEALDLPDSNGNPVDVVVMDDFFYAEPVAVPEPAAALLAAMAIAAASRARRVIAEPARRLRA